MYNIESIQGLSLITASSMGFLLFNYYRQVIQQPRLLFKQSDKIQDLTNKCKALRHFNPSVFLLLDYHGHFNSIFPAWIRSIWKTNLCYFRELYRVSDGGTVGLD